MPTYVCPECGESAIYRLVLIEGTLMHYECALHAGKIGRPVRPRQVRPQRVVPPGSTER